MLISGIIAIVVAYLLGSIPWAYIITRFSTDQDIRELGSKNPGAFNVMREVGLKEAASVTILDIVKGSLAIFLIPALLQVPEPFFLATGVAAVAGHVWPVFLRFKGSTALAPVLGVLAVMVPRDVAIILAVAVLIIIVTRNPVLSINAALVLMIPAALVIEHDLLFFIFTLVIAALMITAYVPVARAALAEAGSRHELMVDVFRTDRGKKKEPETAEIAETPAAEEKKATRSVRKRKKRSGR